MIDKDNDDGRLKLAADAPKAILFGVGQQQLPVIALPPNWTSRALTELLPTAHAQTPAFIDELVTVEDNFSFVGYLERFENGCTLFQVLRKEHVVRARLDYHPGKDATPGHDKHLLTRKFNYTRAFESWLKKDGVRMRQRDFAEFLEDRIEHLAPDGPVAQSTLMNAVLQFKATQNAACTQHVNLTNGDTELQYTRDTKVVSAALPEALQLQIPVFEFGAEWTINARLRFEVKEQAVVFWFDLVKIDDLREEAFALEVDKLRKVVAAQGTWLLQ